MDAKALNALLPIVPVGDHLKTEFSELRAGTATSSEPKAPVVCPVIVAYCVESGQCHDSRSAYGGPSRAAMLRPHVQHAFHYLCEL